MNDAAESYVAARDERMEHSKTESEAKEALITVMRKHDLMVYRDDDMNPPLVVTLVPGKDGVKVTKADDEEGEEAA